MMRDLVQFVRQLWEDRLQSLEEFTKENNLSVEEALQMRNKELEGCMKDLESQTDALLEALEEADSLLASPRRNDEKLHRKLALGECLQRIGKQEEEAERAYDRERVEFLRQARQLLIDSFQTDSPVLSASSLVDEAAAASVEKRILTNEEVFEFAEVPQVCTEEQDMQTDEAAREEAATQTKALIAKKIKALKKQTDMLAPKILQREKNSSKSPKRSPKRLSPESAEKKKLKASKCHQPISPQYINARLKIRAPSPRRNRLPWESATEEDGDDGYTSTDLSPTLPPQPNNSAASLAEPSDENMGFETAEETLSEQLNREKRERQNERRMSQSPKRTKTANKSKSPKRTVEAPDGRTPEQQQQQPPAPPVSANTVTDLGQGEGGRPRRRRSKTHRSQMKSSGAAAVGSSDEEEGERRRCAAEPHGDGGRPTPSRRRSPRTAGDGSPARPERRATAPARAARTKHALSPPPASHVYCLTAVPTPLDPEAVAAAAAAVQSDSKLLHVEPELGAKQRVAQLRPARRKRCSGGGDTISVQSFTSAEEGRGRGALEARGPAVHTPAEPGLPGAIGGEAAPQPAGFRPLQADHGLYQQDPFPVTAATPPAPEELSTWLQRTEQRDGEMDASLADGQTEDATEQQTAGDDSGFHSEALPRGPAAVALYVPPLKLPLLTTSDTSEAASPQPRPKSDTEIAGLGTPRSPRSPIRGGLGPTSPVRQLERSFSCEVPAKKQRCTEESDPVAVAPASQGSGDQRPVATAPPRQLTPKVSRSFQSPTSALIDTPPSQQETSSPPASPCTGYTPQPSPGECTITTTTTTTTSDGSEFRDCPAQPAAVAQRLAGAPSPETTPATSSGPVSPATPGAQASRSAPAAVPVAAAVSSSSSTGLLRKDYEQLRTALTELKELQTSFQRDFAANEQAKEASNRLQSDIQRMETSIQELQDIVSQEYEQTRLDHEETRSAIEQIETRVEESERITQSQLSELRARLGQIADRITQLEGDVSREKNALTAEKEEGANAPDVLTLSSMLTRLETEVITLRHEVDSNRHSIDSITSVTQLDSPKPSPSSGPLEQSTTSGWQDTGRSDGPRDGPRGGPAPAAERSGGDTGGQHQQPAAAAAAQPASQQQQQQAARPGDLDSFRDSNSDLMDTAEEGNEDEQGEGEEEAEKEQPQRQRQQQRPAQTEPPEQRRPAAISPLKMARGRRSVSCCSRHQPEVLRPLRPLRQLHLSAPAPAARRGQRSRSAAPAGYRDGSGYDSPLQEYWAADLSTASASTESPLVNESTRVHHGSSRDASGRSEERHRKTEAFLSKLDGTTDPSDKLDQLQQKLLALRRRVVLSLYRRQRRRAVSEGPRGRRSDQQQQQQQQRRRAQLAAIDRRLRQRLHGWNHRLLSAEPPPSTLSPCDVVSDSSFTSRELRRSPEQASDSGSPPPAPASQRAASQYLRQLGQLLAGPAQDELKVRRASSRGRYRDRTLSPPTKDPGTVGWHTSNGRRRCRPTAVTAPGEHMERFVRNESKLVELQEYLGGIRQHLQRMASELDSPTSALPPPAAAWRGGARGLPATHAVVFRPWTRRYRSVSSQRPMVTLRY